MATGTLGRLRAHGADEADGGRVIDEDRERDATAEELYAALTSWDEHVREVRLVARGERTVADVLVARLRGWRADAIAAALVESAALGAEGDGARSVAAGEAIVMRRLAREPRMPVRWRVIHEDGRLVVVDKGPGIPVHPAGAFVERTLLRSMRRAGYAVHPAHRLDRETSGIVVFARDKADLAALQEMWASGAVRKRYLAVVAPAPEWDETTASQPIGPAHAVEQVRQGVDVPGAKPAVTHVRVIARSASSALLACEPETGRQHQLRVHLAALGCPLLGDKLYRGDGATYLRVARGEATVDEVRALGHPRHALHAAELWIPGAHPLHVRAPLPLDLRELLLASGLPALP